MESEFDWPLFADIVSFCYDKKTNRAYEIYMCDL